MPKRPSPNQAQTANSQLWRARARVVIAAITAGLMVAFGLVLVAPPATAAGTTFSSTWDTTKTSTGSSAANQIKLPLVASGNYNFVVDWGDGSNNTITAWNQADVTHTYASSGVKNVSIAGTIKGWQFANSGDKLKITDISAWGPLQLGNDGAYFWGASNLNLTATDGPDLTSTNNLSNTFLNATKVNADLSGWDVSGVTNLTGAFRGATAFNGDLSAWNVGAVTSMNGTFRGATAFNRDISGWNVSAVTNMTSMFNGATSFDQDLGPWDVSNVLDMPSMFASAGVSRTNYDSLLIGWAALDVKPDVEFDAGSAKYTSGPASTAHDELTEDDGWEITDGGITSAPDAPTTVSTTRADTGATATWNESVSNNEAVLEYVATISPAPNSGSAACSVIPPASRSCTWANLNNGETYSITVTARNEVGTSAPSTPVTVVPEVDVPNPPGVDDLSAVALDAKARVTWTAPDGGGTPTSYTATASPGGETCTANMPTLTCEVLGLTNGTDYTFTVTATNPGGTSDPSAASNEVTPGPVFETLWDTTKVEEGGSGLQQIRLPLVADGEYDFIVDWGDGSFSNIVTGDVEPGNLSGVTHNYATGGVKRLTITGLINGWNFTNGVAGDKERLKLQEVVSWGSLQLGTLTVQGEYFKGTTNMVVSATDALDLTGTTSLAGAFQGATAFNGAAGSWDVSGVTDMSSMFAGATSFNQPLADWVPGNVTTMANMFAGATAFNQDLTGWGNLGSVTTMESMFDGASAFNGDVAWTNLDDLSTTAGMFNNADAFNQDLDWPVAQPALTNTAGMFGGTALFDGDVSTLDMSDVTDASEMFKNAAAFNQPVGGWTLGSAVDISDMFSGAIAFNQDVSGWDFEGVTRFGQFLNNSGLANANAASGVYNYNLFLQALAAQNVLPDNGPGSTTADRTIDSAPAKYSTGLPADAHESLEGRGFVITDGGLTDKNVPDAPENIGGNTDANPPTITWTAPDDNNSPIVSYTVTATHESDPVENETAYCETSGLTCTFGAPLEDAPGNFTYSVTATNAIGTSAPSASTAPDTPAQPIAVAGDSKATVTIVPPSAGAAPTTYEVTSTPESKTCTITVPATSCDVTGLTNDTSYTFTAVAENWVGLSAPSPATTAVVPGKVLAMTWRTNNTSAGSSAVNQIKLPLTNEVAYNFHVAWGDGTTSHITAYNQAEVTHTYALPGTKNVTITGTINGWRFDDSGDRLKLLGISSWGPLQLGNARNYFSGASNLVVTATDVLNLAGTTDLFGAFQNAAAFNANVTGWDVDQVTDMTNAFKGTAAFTGTGLSTWNVSAVAQMDSMFEGSGMNADITAWNTSSSEDMNRMFASATNFNQAISGWNTEDVEDMTGMFSGATAFNQDISNWNTAKVVGMAGMFEGSGIDTTRSFADWNIEAVTNFTNMFRNNPGLAMPGAVSWYNELLTGWAPQISTTTSRTLTVCGAADSNGSTCGDGAPQYSAGSAENARLDLIDNGFTVIDGGLSSLNVPDQIVNVTSLASGADTIVSWPAPADNGSTIDHYTVTAVDAADHSATAACTVVSTTTATCVGQSKATYLFSVTATNGVGTSIPSSIAVPGINPLLVQPAGSGALRITIDPATTGGTPESFVVANAMGGPYLCQFAMPTQSCIVSGLTNGTDYQFIAVASNWVGESVISAPSAPVAPTGDALVSTWDTENTSAGSSNSTSVSLPLVEGGTYDFVVQWGDGTSGVVTSAADADATHAYAERGEQNIVITGVVNGWSFNDTGDKLKLTNISDWGSLGLGNEGGAFQGAANFTLSTADAPDLTGVTNLGDTFSGAAAFNGDVSAWNVSAVTDMSGMFSASGFTGDISGWNTESVTTMGGMFADTAFNGDISEWDTSSLTDINNMFNASAFTGDISGWDVTGITNASGLFQNISTMTGPSFINWYNNLLTSWAAQAIPTRGENSVPFSACGSVDSATACTGGLQYYGTAATAARDSLIAKGWQVFDGGVAAANVPDVPTITSVVRAGTEATVSWSAPADNGSPITGYQVTTDPGAITCATDTTTCLVTGLNADENVKYSYTLTATNEVGTSAASDPYPAARPGAPGTPTAVAGDASATVTVTAPTTGGTPVAYIVTANPGGATCTIEASANPLSCQVNGLTNGVAYTFTAVSDNAGGTSEASAPSNEVTPLAPARNAEFEAPTPTANGFTAQIEDFDGSFAWTGTATNGGVVAVNETGLVTVTGVAPDTASTATINVTRYGYEPGTGSVSATSLKAGLIPTFTLPVTPTANGFTVQISNYSGLYDWSGTSTASGVVDVSETGLVEVSNVAPDTLADVIITTTRGGYANATAPVSGTSLKAKLTPAFGAPTPTADGFTVAVTNFSSTDDFTWAIESATPVDAVADLNQTSGLVTVTGIDPNTAASVTVTTTQPGFAIGSATNSSKSLNAAWTPEFGTETPTPDGFTVQISNYGNEGNGFEWTVPDVEPDTVVANINEDTGLLTVSNVVPATEATVTVMTTKDDYVDGSAPISGEALAAAGTPDFGTVVRTDGGFTVPIENYDDDYEWDASVSDGAVAIAEGCTVGTCLVTVTELDDGQTVTLTVTTEREGFADGEASIDGTALDAPRNPEFGTPTRTPDGYTVAITNYGTEGDDFTWEIAAVEPGTAQAALDEATGVLTVTDVSPAAEALVTVTTEKSGYLDGSAQVAGNALVAAWNPTFSDLTQTNSGYTVQITNYDPNPLFTVTPSATITAVTPTISGTGLVTVSGLQPGTTSTLTVTTVRDGYVSGVGETTGASITGPARTPEFGEVTRTDDGFTVPITNYGVSGDGYTWTTNLSPSPEEAAAAINPETGVLAVTGFTPGTDITVTVNTTRTGYASASDDISSRSLDPQVNPVLGTPEPTKEGFTVQITNFNEAGVTWTASVVPEPATVSVNLQTGLVTVAGLPYATESTVTVYADKEDHVQGSATATATSQNGDAYDPEFDEPTRTAGGFTVQVADYLPGYTWEFTLSPGNAVIDASTGLITVTNVPDGESSTVAVVTKRDGYDDGDGEFVGQALNAAYNFGFDELTPTASGFTVKITQYDAVDFTWTASATNTVVGVQISSSGVATVTGVAPGTESTLTVSAANPDYITSTKTVSEFSINGPAVDPVFGTAVRTADGFTVPITNYNDEGSSSYTWTPSVTNGGAATIADSGLVTVTGLAPGALGTLTVDVTRTGYDTGTESIGEQALDAALIPTFATPVSTATGFTVQITNYDQTYDWPVSATNTDQDVSLDEGTGLVTVTGVDPATESTLTVETTKDGHAPGSAQVSATSLASPENPTFGTPTRTPDGYTVSVSNFDADDAFTWAVGSSTDGQAELNQTSGLLTVTGLGAAAPATVTVTTTRDGYVPGSGTVTGNALNAARTPTFDTPTRTADGYTVQLANFDNDFEWNGSATNTSEPVLISDSGLVTVSGLAPDTLSVATITTTRDGYVGGTATVQDTALKAALVPTYSTPIRTVDGFQVTVTNYDSDFTWAADATNTSYNVEVDDAGLIEVTGVSPGITSVVTVTTTQIGFTTGTSEVSAAAIEGGALIPIFGTVVPTAVGFDVQIENYRSGFEWTVNGAPATVSPTGYLSVVGLAPGSAATVTVIATRPGYATGSNSVVGVSDPQAISAPPAVIPRPATITKITVKQKKNNKSSAKISFTPGGDGGAPLLGSKAACKQKGAKAVVKASGSSLSALTVKKLKNKKKYVCTVAVYNALGASVPSASKSFKVKG